MIHFLVPLRGIKCSTNTIYAGIHWSKRKEIKDGIASVAGAFCRPVQKIQSYPVQIYYRFLFGTRPLDTLNTTFMAKCFEDAFRALGILKDDSPKYVAKTILEVGVVGPWEIKKKIAALGPKADAKDKDWLEITIDDYKH